VEKNGIQSIERLTGHHRDTIGYLLEYLALHAEGSYFIVAYEIPEYYAETCVDYGQVIKIREGGKIVEKIKKVIYGTPNIDEIETTGSLIEINVTAYIHHIEGEARNATMLIRAINSNTGLHEAEVSTPIPESDSDKTVTASAKLKVERNGNYDLRILLYDNGSIRESGSVGIKGLNALTPAVKQSGVAVKNIDFIIAGASGGIASIRSDVYLENKWAAPSDKMNMIVKARQAESNLLADKKASETGVITGEATSVKRVHLDMPEGYNYMMVVELWKGDVLVNTWEKALMLAPTKTVPKESQEKKMNIEVSKFMIAMLFALLAICVYLIRERLKKNRVKIGLL
jgi:hypothetical protein